MASMGVKGPEKPDDEFVRFAEPKRGIYKSVVIRDGKLIGAMLLGDTKKVAFLTQSFDRGLPLPEERVEMLFELAGPTRGAGRGRDGRLGAGLQLQRGVQGRSRRVRARRRAQRHGLYERDPGGQGLRGVQAAGRETSSSGR